MFPLPPIFAFGFSSPVMLFALAAVVVPLLIHLWSRRRYRQMYWAAMEYLLAAIRRSRRRLQLEQLLLLLVRTLVITLVVLALAEPYLERVGFGFMPGARTHRVLVIDGSYSMGYRPTDKTRFDQAKELAVRIVEASPQGDGFTLVLMSEPPRVVVGNPVFEPRDLLPEIEGLSLPHTTADVPATLANVERILIAARREHPRLAREEVYFLTDLGRVGWRVDSDDPETRTEFQKRARRLAESAALVVIDLGQDAAENLAVTDLSIDEQYVTVGHTLNVEAVLKNFGRQMRNRQTVELVADGRRVRQESVDLAPGAEVSVGFSHRFESPGDHTLEVRLGKDLLEIDDHRWMAIRVKPVVRVLCVEGRPSGEPFGGAAGYLATALSPQADPIGQAVIRPEVVPESELLERELTAYDCVFFCNVAQFTSSEARALEGYLKRGGSLVFFLGDQVMADRYNRELGGGRGGGVDLLPARLGPLVTEPEYRVDPLDYRHPIIRSFRGHERAGLLITPVAAHYKLTVPKRSKSKVVLALESKDPLIVESPVYRGRVVLFATSADASWTWMPKLTSYVPIVQDVLAYAIADQLHEQNVEVGQPLGAVVAPEAADAPLVVQRPDGGREEVRLRTEEGSGTWSYSETGTSGIYTAQFGPPLSRNEAFAVNVDPVESDLARLSLEQLRNEVWPDVPFLHQTSWEHLDDPPVGRASRSSTLAKGLLYAVLTLLFAETFLAWRFGHHPQ